MCKVFILLTGGASFYVLFQPLLCFWPEVSSLDFSYGFVSSWVSISVVPVSCDFLLNFFVWWDHKFVGGDGSPSLVLLSRDYMDW